MPTVYKTASDRTKKSARWMVAWTDELGHRRTRRGYTDKALSERLARQLEDAARARREGTIDAAAERMADHSRRPLADHVADYRVYLAAKGSTEEHVDLTEARIEQAVRAHRGVPEDSAHYFDEIHVTSAHNYHFAKCLKQGRYVVVLVTKKTTNIGMGWAQLKAVIPNIEPLLP